jgi:valyl-tRNA synthetase
MNDKPNPDGTPAAEPPAPRHDAAAAEARWGEAWEAEGVHLYQGGRPRAETFVVDTPPPTMSGTLHVGHVFSYTQTDVIVRQRRMRGLDVFYPMGWDDNGLPTERRVQSLYHVRVDVGAPHQPDLQLEPASTEQRKQPPRRISRPAFIELCARVTAEDERAFEALWRRLGLSVDWRARYATIDEHCRRVAQHSFRDLFDKGHLYSAFAPTLWDVDFQTAIAQAEVEERPQQGALHEIAFEVEGSADTFVIATTRPELLPACVGVAAHPDDPRHRALIGRTALTPLFRAPVPIFASPLVEPDKGTGILMVCTFGDATDVAWWRAHDLPLRQILGLDGRLLPVTFGQGVWQSRDPRAANAAYAALAGKTVKQARAAVVARLREPPASALRGEPRPIERAVKFFEKGDQPLELIPTRQWFVRLLDRKSELLVRGEEVRWHPEYMHHRYRSWVEGLQYDWCISRQRTFGVPFPLWYPLDAEGRPDHERPLVADRFPVDPTTDVPPGYEPAARDQPGGFCAERDVFDTWFTSSLTPQITSGWPDDPERHARLFPADLRPQSHEIIRTWAFYTIVKALLHEGTLPWQHVAVSGWILDPDRKKMSKSRGNVVTPAHLLDTYGADGARYWAASARLGTDTAFDEKVMKVGKRLVTKLWNAGRYVLALSAPAGPIRQELDRAFIHRLAATVDAASRAFDDFDYAGALAAIEEQLWRWFTDSYLELTKGRVRGESGAEGRDSAVAALRLGLDVLLRLLAPFLPYVTEELWRSGHDRSVHRASWPGPADLAHVAPPDDAGSLARAAAMMSAINRAKTELGASVGRVVTELALGAHPATLARLPSIVDDVLAAVRCPPAVAVLLERPDLPEDTFAVVRLQVQAAERKAPAQTDRC